MNLPKETENALRKLNTPAKIQDFLDDLLFNFEEEAETCKSPMMTLKEKRVHCIEGALLACAALMLNGKPPLVMNLKVNRRVDDDHVVVLFREEGLWGSISKTNHAVLRYRDPVYRNPRELAMSYFNEYFISDGRKTMTGFSRPINLRRFGTKWITEEKDLWHIAEYIYDSEHISILPKHTRIKLRKASESERKAASI